MEFRIWVFVVAGSRVQISVRNAVLSVRLRAFTVSEVVHVVCGFGHFRV